MSERRPDPPGDDADVAAGRAESIPATRPLTPPAAEPLTTPTRPVSRRPSNSRPPLEIGTKLGRYVILERLGAGGLGVVYKAYDPELDRRLAIKIVRMSSSQSEDAAATQARFLREAQALAQLNHPNVLAVHDVGVVDDEVFIAMELVEGQTFKDWHRAKPRARPEVLSILLAAGRGLSAAHRAGLVHRDFKPSNILIGDDQRVRVIDFGLARATDEPSSNVTPPPRRDGPDPTIPASTGGHSSDRLLSSPLTLAGTVMGTPGYMAPEQYEGDVLNPRTDQFAFCVTLFEALCGRRPFSARSQAELAQALASRAIERGLEDGRVPKWIRRIVLRGLSARPEARYPSMDALLEALSRDPAARARRIAAAVGLAIAVAAATFAVAHRSAQPNEICQGAPESMRAAWNVQRGGKLRAAFAATGRRHASATADRVIEKLDLHAKQWVAMHTDTCKATHVRGEQSPALLDLRMSCLHRRRSELAALASLLAERADADVVDHAVEAVVGLPSLALCADDRALTMGQPLPASLTARVAIEQLEGRLDEINALRSAGNYKAGLGLAEQLVREAAPLGYASLSARAQLTLARLQQSASEHRAAELALHATILAAAAARDDQLLAQGWLELYWAVAYVQARKDAADLLRISAQAAVARAGDDPALRGQLVNSDASMSYLRGDYAKARVQFQEALSYRQQANDGLEIAAAYNNIGLTYYKEGDYAQAITFQQRGLELRERILGPEHPTVVSSLNNLGIAHERSGDRGRARMYYERALAIREGIFGPDHPSLAGLINNIGNILYLEGDYEGATRHLERALALKEASLGPNHPSVSVTLDSLGSVMMARHDYERARQLYARSLAMSDAADANHPNAAYALTGLGESLIALGRPQEAIPLLERALRVRTTQKVDVADIGETRLHLARARWAAGRDRAQALGLARVARDELARGGPVASKTLAVAEAWLAERAPPK